MSRDVTRLDKPAPREAKKSRWPRRVSRKKQAEIERGELADARATIIVRSHGRCEAETGPRCLRVGSHAHHKLPRSAGGRHDPETLLWVCAPCHQIIHENPNMAYARGLLIRRGVR